MIPVAIWYEYHTSGFAVYPKNPGPCPGPRPAFTVEIPVPVPLLPRPAIASELRTSAVC